MRLMDAEYTLGLLAGSLVSTDGLAELAAPAFVWSRPMSKYIDEPLWDYDEYHECDDAA